MGTTTGPADLPVKIGSMAFPNAGPFAGATDSSLLGEAGLRASADQPNSIAHKPSPILAGHLHFVPTARKSRAADSHRNEKLAIFLRNLIGLYVMANVVLGEGMVYRLSLL